MVRAARVSFGLMERLFFFAACLFAEALLSFSAQARWTQHAFS
jgi:hypothetical protein